jgi:hypothetical protein
MAQDWDIRPRSDTCNHCGQPFQDGQTYVSALVFGAEGYVRADSHEACWADLPAGSAREAGAQAGLLPGFAGDGRAYSTWRSVFRAPPPPEEEAIRKETAESLLRKLMETENEANRNIIYILAVMLERKRTLAERAVENREDGMTLRIYEHRKTKETFVVPEPHLQLDQLESVQAQVVAMLDGHGPGAEHA